MARVSVVVPTQNSRDALMATVETILNQSYTDLELIIADDGSDDGTGMEVLTRLGPDASRAEKVWWDSLQEKTGTRSIQMIRNQTLVHYLHSVNRRGPAATRNRAVAVSNGEFLAYADPGDAWQRHKLSAQVETLDSHQEVGACLEPVPPKKKQRFTSRRTCNVDMLRFEDLLTCRGQKVSGSILRRQCIDSEAPFDENLPVCEEYDFWLRIASRYPVARMLEAFQIPATQAKCQDWGLERFRVYALEKAYQSGHLSAMMRHRVAEELVRECEHLVEGYRSRDNPERANFYDRKKKRFFQEVAKLDVSDPIFTRAPAT